MRVIKLLPSFGILIGATAGVGCPYTTGEIAHTGRDGHHELERRQQGDSAATETEQFLSQFYLNNTDSFITTDVGGPISDQTSLKAGERGSTLLEDFIFRQKIQHFDHERVS
jgi:catalase